MNLHPIISNHQPIKEADRDFMGHILVKGYREALLYFVHVWLSIHLRVVSIIGQLWRFHRAVYSFYLLANNINKNKLRII